MKTAKIHVNKTAQKPQGVEIDLVQPESDLEGRLLSYLITHAVREAKRENRIPYKLPTAFSVDHRGEGTFAVLGTPPPGETAAPVPGGGYYQPPRPLAIVGIRSIGVTFELIHAELNPDTIRKAAEVKKAETQQPQPQPATPAAKEPEQLG